MFMFMKGLMWFFTTKLYFYQDGPSLINRHDCGHQIIKRLSMRHFTNGQMIFIWFHDKSTLYVNDQWVVCWAHKSEDPVPWTKGEGASLMAMDFISANYGWIALPDGSEWTQVLFKAGKSHEGYFTNDDIIKHLATLPRWWACVGIWQCNNTPETRRGCPISNETAQVHT